MKYNKGKHAQRIKKVKIIPFCIFTILLVISSYFVYNYIGSSNNRRIYEEIDTSVINTANNKNVEKVKYLRQINEEVIGWLKINNTDIDYPLLQTRDNSYYLTHNYKKEESKYGSIFINNKSNVKDDKSNIIIYGHNMKDKQMFNSLLKYENKEYYDNHNIIKVATEKEENDYLIISVFKSRIFYRNEKDVFRYYNYTYFDNETEYTNFINKCKEIQLYDTNIQAKYGEQLITLITCDYSQENGRLVIIAKKIS